MRGIVNLLGILVAFSAFNIGSVAPADSTVASVTITTVEQLNVTQALEQDGYITILDPKSIVFAPSDKQYVTTILTNAGIAYEIENLNAMNDEVVHLKGKNKNVFDVNDSNSNTVILNQINVWTSSCPNGLSCTSKVIGTTVESRQIKVIRFSKSGSNNKVIWIDGTTEGRDWRTGAVIAYLAHAIVNHYGTTTTQGCMFTELLDEFDIELLIIANPDGYEFTRTASSDDARHRFWAKTRKQSGPSNAHFCRGARMHLNFDTYFNAGLNLITTDWYCVNNYPGPFAASEVEVQAIQNETLALKNSNGVAAYFHLEMFGRLWMTPLSRNSPNNAFNGWEWFFPNCIAPNDHNDLKQTAQAAIDAMNALSSVPTAEHRKWRTFTECEMWIFALPGTEIDWMYDNIVPYSYVVRLMPSFGGSWNEKWILDPAEIAVAYNEFIVGMYANMKEICQVENSYHCKNKLSNCS